MALSRTGLKFKRLLNSRPSSPQSDMDDDYSIRFPQPNWSVECSDQKGLFRNPREPPSPPISLSGTKRKKLSFDRTSSRPRGSTKSSRKSSLSFASSSNTRSPRRISPASIRVIRHSDDLDPWDWNVAPSLPDTPDSSIGCDCAACGDYLCSSPGQVTPTKTTSPPLPKVEKPLPPVWNGHVISRPRAAALDPAPVYPRPLQRYPAFQQTPRSSTLNISEALSLLPAANSQTVNKATTVPVSHVSTANGATLRGGLKYHNMSASGKDLMREIEEAFDNIGVPMTNETPAGLPPSLSAKSILNFANNGEPFTLVSPQLDGGPLRPPRSSSASRYRAVPPAINTRKTSAKVVDPLSPVQHKAIAKAPQRRKSKVYPKSPAFAPSSEMTLSTPAVPSSTSKGAMKMLGSLFNSRVEVNEVVTDIQVEKDKLRRLSAKTQEEKRRREAEQRLAMEMSVLAQSAVASTTSLALSETTRRRSGESARAQRVSTADTDTSTPVSPFHLQDLPSRIGNAGLRNSDLSPVKEIPSPWGSESFEELLRRRSVPSSSNATSQPGIAVTKDSPTETDVPISSIKFPLPPPPGGLTPRTLPPKALPPLPAFESQRGSKRLSKKSERGSELFMKVTSPTTPLPPLPEADDSYIYFRSTTYTLTTAAIKHGAIRLDRTAVAQRTVFQSSDDLDPVKVKAASLQTAAAVLTVSEPGDFEEYQEFEAATCDELIEWFAAFAFDGPGMMIGATDHERIERRKKQIENQRLRWQQEVDIPTATGHRMHQPQQSNLGIAIATGLPPPVTQPAHALADGNLVQQEMVQTVGSLVDPHGMLMHQKGYWHAQPFDPSRYVKQRIEEPIGVAKTAVHSFVEESMAMGNPGLGSIARKPIQPTVDARNSQPVILNSQDEEGDGFLEWEMQNAYGCGYFGPGPGGR